VGQISRDFGVNILVHQDKVNLWQLEIMPLCLIH